MITGRRPSGRLCASATVIGPDIYMFGGMLLNRASNALWKLTGASTGCFAWHEIKSKSDKKSPSPRYGHSAWEFSSKLWIFGGCDVHVTDQSDHLNNYGSFARDGLENNQVLCFDPLCQEWTNPRSFGDIPQPRCWHGTAIIRDKVWLLGGSTNDYETLDDLYELDMLSLTWTMIENTVLRPYDDGYCTLTAITEDQLVMHYGKSKTNEHSNINTWILDLSSMSWREYTAADYNPRINHTCTQGINSSVVIIGGEFKKPYENIHITLKTKSLQHLASQTIWKHKHTLPWKKTLPRKLKCLFGFL